MRIFFSKVTIDQWLLAIIVIVGTLLRFWDFDHLPFMADELSALARTNYPTLTEELYYGVKLDGHPAGVQLFIYYWIKLFGYSEIAVKLPFIVLGILSIIIAYRISLEWFNNSVALVVASLMASTQYMVTYGQIARPYVSGLFFCLFMVWCWSNFLFGIPKNRKWWLIGFILSASIASYNHHMALLFVIVVGITGLFFLNKDNYKAYILSGFVVVLLYVPHLNIFFYQLGGGGVGGADGWLGAPKSGWFVTYLKYIFHFSGMMYFMVILLLLLSFYTSRKGMGISQKFRIVCVCWFFTIFLIEYFYSIFVNPIIQYSTLIFVSPFLLMFLFSLMGNLNASMKSIVVIAILVTASYTLIKGRKHFQVFYEQPFEAQIKNAINNLAVINNDTNVTNVLFVPPFYGNYYIKKYNRPFNYVYYDEYFSKPDPKAFREFVQQQQTNYFITGNLPADYIEIIKEYYPYKKDKQEGFTFCTYCFCKTRELSEMAIVPVEKKVTMDFCKEKFEIDSLSEYGPVCSYPLNTYFKDRHHRLIVSALISAPEKQSNPILVMNIRNEEKQIKWAGADYLKYADNSDGFGRVYLIVDFTSIDLSSYENPIADIYIWNPDKKKVFVEEIKIEVEEGNHLLYSLLEPID